MQATMQSVPDGPEDEVQIGCHQQKEKKITHRLHDYTKRRNLVFLESSEMIYS